MADDADTPIPHYSDTSPLPRVSIVTPSYNQGQFLEETIRSVLLQGYPNLEYIIIDGGSSDRSVEIIKKYEPWIDYWVSEPDGGQSHAINKGFAKATGEVYGWLNSDDCFAPGALATLMDLRAKKPDAVAWVGACDEVEADGTHIARRAPWLGDQEQIATWWRRAFFHQPSCLFDANTFRAVEGVDEGLFYSMDMDLWVRLAGQGSFVGVDEVVSYSRMHPATKTAGGHVPLHYAINIMIPCRQGLMNAAVVNLRQYVFERQLAAVERMDRKRLLAALEEEGLHNVLHALPFSRVLRHLLHRSSTFLS